MQVMASVNPWSCEAGQDARDAAGDGTSHSLHESHHRNGEQVSLPCRSIVWYELKYYWWNIISFVACS